MPFGAVSTHRRQDHSTRKRTFRALLGISFGQPPRSQTGAASLFSHLRSKSDRLLGMHWTNPFGVSDRQRLQRSPLTRNPCQNTGVHPVSPPRCGWGLPALVDPIAHGRSILLLQAPVPPKEHGARGRPRRGREFGPMPRCGQPPIPPRAEGAPPRIVARPVLPGYGRGKRATAGAQGSLSCMPIFSGVLRSESTPRLAATMSFTRPPLL